MRFNFDRDSDSYGYREEFPCIHATVSHIQALDTLLFCATTAGTTIEVMPADGTDKIGFRIYAGAANSVVIFKRWIGAPSFNQTEQMRVTYQGCSSTSLPRPAKGYGLVELGGVPELVYGAFVELMRHSRGFARLISQDWKNTGVLRFQLITRTLADISSAAEFLESYTRVSTNFLNVNARRASLGLPLKQDIFEERPTRIEEEFLSEKTSDRENARQQDWYWDFGPAWNFNSRNSGFGGKHHAGHSGHTGHAADGAGHHEDYSTGSDHRSNNGGDQSSGRSNRWGFPPAPSLKPAKDLYAVLGLAKTATSAEIKSAFRMKAKTCHPDLFGGDKQKEKEFKELNEAYQKLSDPQQRAAYDLYGT